MQTLPMGQAAPEMHSNDRILTQPDPAILAYTRQLAICIADATHQNREPVQRKCICDGSLFNVQKGQDTKYNALAGAMLMMLGHTIASPMTQYQVVLMQAVQISEASIGTIGL